MERKNNILTRLSIRAIIFNVLFTKFCEFSRAKLPFHCCLFDVDLRFIKSNMTKTSFFTRQGDDTPQQANIKPSA